MSHEESVAVRWGPLPSEGWDVGNDPAGARPVVYLGGCSHPAPCRSQMERSLGASRGRKRLCLRLPDEPIRPIWPVLVGDREREAKGSLGPTNASVAFLG